MKDPTSALAGTAPNVQRLLVLVSVGHSLVNSGQYQKAIQHLTV